MKRSLRGTYKDEGGGERECRSQQGRVRRICIYRSKDCLRKGIKDQEKETLTRSPHTYHHLLLFLFPPLFPPSMDKTPGKKKRGKEIDMSSVCHFTLNGSRHGQSNPDSPGERDWCSVRETFIKYSHTAI